MSDELTPKEAYARYNGLEGYDEHTNKEIAEIFDVSRNTVRARRKTFEEMNKTAKETAQDVVDERLETMGIDEAITDEPDENNPYDMITCPSCGGDIERPEEPGKGNCEHCKTQLRFDESDTK